jgi:3-methylcrotonyl-CoA carboxylase alpha subunit
MGAAAVRIAKAAGYVNAGTMEFILDADKHFYFLEMNTRLQVEHPVTEEVTGLDLVRHQLLIAAGEPLAITQEQVSHRGHAIEVRLYAEDPAHNFLPSTGTISTFVKPEGPGVRVDSGIDTGDEITQFYDPMIAKLIVYGEDRNAAIARLQRALEHCVLLGVTTNIPLLYAIAQHPAFQAGRTHTGFLDEHNLLQSRSASQPALPQEALIAAAVYEVQQASEQERLQNISTSNPWRTLGPWRMIGDTRTITYQYHAHTYTIALTNYTPMTPTWTVQIGSQPTETITAALHNDKYVLLKRGTAQEEVEVYVQQSKHEMQVALQGQVYHLKRRQALDIDSIAHRGSTNTAQKTLTAPMAGTIVKVQVHEGEIVEAQQVLVILSAMKMEHAITAPHEGKVRRVLYQEGSVVKGGATVVEME